MFLQKWDIYRKLRDRTLADKCWMELSDEKQKPDTVEWKISEDSGLA